MDAALARAGRRPPTTSGARCGRTLPAWRSLGPRPAVYGMRSILPCVRSRSWGGNPRTACCGGPLGLGRECAPWDEARTPVIQHAHDFYARRGTAARACEPDVQSPPSTPATYV